MPEVTQEGGTVTQEGGTVTHNVGDALHGILDDVEAGINEILGESGDDLEGSHVVYNEGNDGDAILEKIFLDVETIALYLGAGYTMEELQAIPGVELELDDSPHVELVIFECF